MCDASHRPIIMAIMITGGIIVISGILVIIICSQNEIGLSTCVKPAFIAALFGVGVLAIGACLSLYKESRCNESYYQLV